MLSRHALPFLALAALAGCITLPLPSGSGGDDGNTIGDQGKVEVSYAGPSGTDGCENGCSLEMALMAGDDEPIGVEPHNPLPLPPLAFRSSDPSIIDVSPAIADRPNPFGRQATLEGHAAGSATLLISDADTQAPFDSATVHVAPVASLAVSFQINGASIASPPGELTLSVGQEADASFQTFDAQGGQLAGWNGVSLSVGDGSVASIGIANVTFVTALASGQTTLTERAGSVTKGITLVVH